MNDKKLDEVVREVSILLKVDGEMSADEQEDFLKSKGWERVYHKGKFLAWLQPKGYRRPDRITLFHTDDAVAIQKTRDSIRVK